MSSNQFRVWLNNEYLPKHPECFWIKEAYSKAVTQAVNNGQAAFIRFLNIRVVSLDSKRRIDLM